MPSRPSILPEYITPEQLAVHFGMSERAVKDKVRELGAYAKLGNRQVMFSDHVEIFTEAIQCPSSCTSAEKSGTSGGQLPDGDFTSLRKRLTEKQRSASKRRSKAKPGNVVSMGRERD